MEGPGVDFKYPPKKVSWLKRDVLLFNVSIGCGAQEPQFVYELDENFSAFPTYPLALVFKLDNQEIIDFASSQKSTKIPGVPDLDSETLVDGQRAIQLLKPLPVTSAGRDFEFRSKVIGVYDKGKAGTVVKSEDALVEVSTGEVYARIIGSWFYVGQGNWGGPRGPKEPAFPMPDRVPDKKMHLKVHENSAHIYRLNGDYNPLHATPEPGKAMGYGGMIVHGVYAYNCIAHDLLRVLGDSKAGNLGEFQAKFAGPVRPGDEIETCIWRMGPGADGWEVIQWEARVVKTGKLCLADGRAVIRTEGLLASRL
ncbi:hypothetical protein ACJ41O_003516 [Fusarium nematophilum]